MTEPTIEEQIERPQISIDITPDGFHVNIPEKLCIADIKNILEGVRDLLVTYMQVENEERLAAQVVPDEIIGSPDEN